MNEGLDIGRAGHGCVAAGNALLWLTFAMLAAGTLLALVPIRDRARAPPIDDRLDRGGGSMTLRVRIDGVRLPTVRALANDLGIAPGTIARAYQELESAGLVVSRRRVGTLVTAPPRSLVTKAPRDAAVRLAALARVQGLTDAEAHDLLAAALIQHEREASRQPVP